MLSNPSAFLPRLRSFLVLAFACLLPVQVSLALDWAGLRPVGSLEGFTQSERGLSARCADKTTLELSVLAPDLVRVRVLFEKQQGTPDHSWALARTDWPRVAFSISETPEAITLVTAELEIVLRKNPLLVEFRDAATHQVINADERPFHYNPETGRIAVAKRIGLDEHFYGLGEKAARLDRRRGWFTMWNSDTPGYVEGTDPIYQSIPFYVGMEEGRAYGLFYDNSHKCWFDMGRSGQDYAGFSAEGGLIDYYFFKGPSLKKVVGRYTELTGRMPLPPLWALGNQQCRYSYYPDTMVEDVARRFRAHDLPLDVLYLDIHYMNEYRVFTWNQKRFPDPSALMEKLGRQGVRVVTIIDPGVKYQPSEAGAAREPAPADPSRAAQDKRYYVFDEGLAKDYFLRRTDGSLYIGEVWPGKAVFIDFTKAEARRWWGGLHRALLDHGISGVWTDMNEPADFLDRNGETQKNVVFDDLGMRSLYGKNRNVFALNMARATYEGLEALRPNLRPFVITRAGYAGVQRYATVWTGDNNATFESLALDIPMFASLGLSGESFVGADIPGFIGRGSGELLARSYQVGFLAPLCRNHGTVDHYDHEPWRYGSAYEDIVRKYLKLRYSLLPFLYTTLEEAHRTGVPFFRPLLLNFQEDENTLNLDDEFMIGDLLLAAPVLREGSRNRDVYLPKGLWYDFWTGVGVEGGSLRSVDAPLDYVPLYVRGGSILPSTVAMNHTAEKPWDPLRFDIYPDQKGFASGSLYEDDGLSPAYRGGVFRRTSLVLNRDAQGSILKIAAPEGSHRTPPRFFELTFHGASTPAVVLLDGTALPLIKAGEVSTGQWRDKDGHLHVRMTDDAGAHQLVFR